MVALHEARLYYLSRSITSKEDLQEGADGNGYSWQGVFKARCPNGLKGPIISRGEENARRKFSGVTRRKNAACASRKKHPYQILH